MVNDIKLWLLNPMKVCVSVSETVTHVYSTDSTRTDVASYVIITKINIIYYHRNKQSGKKDLIYCNYFCGCMSIKPIICIQSFVSLK